MNADRPDDAAHACHYGAYYYEHCCGHPYARTPEWLGLFDHFAARIVGEIAPGTVLDAGCALGLLVEGLRKRGVDAHGIDISDYAIARAHEEVRPFCRVASVTAPPGRRFDLIVCIEVLEHLPAAEAERAVAVFCDHADDVLFSSTPFDYKEATHFNVQPPEYWAGLFARRGYYRDVDFDASFLTRWATRFRKSKDPAWRIVADYERRTWRLLQDNLGSRESLIEHQAKLIQADSARSLVESRLAQAEARSGAIRDENRRLQADFAEKLDEQRRALERAADHRVAEERRAAERLAADRVAAERLAADVLCVGRLEEQRRAAEAGSQARLQGQRDEAARQVAAAEAEAERSRDQLASAREQLAAALSRGDDLLGQVERGREARAEFGRKLAEEESASAALRREKQAAERALAEIRARLDAVASSRAWALARWVSRLRHGVAPDGSRRLAALRSATTWRRDRAGKPARARSRVD